MTDYIIRSKNRKYVVTKDDIGQAHQFARQFFGPGNSFSVFEPDDVDSNLIKQGKIEFAAIIYAPPRPDIIKHPIIIGNDPGNSE